MDLDRFKVNMYDTVCPRPVRTPYFEEEVLKKFEDTSTSTRDVAIEMSASNWAVWSVVHESQLYLFRIQKV